MTCSGIIENLTMGLSAYLQHQKYVGNPGIEAKKKKKSETWGICSRISGI